MPSIVETTSAEASTDLTIKMRCLLVAAFDGEFSEEDWHNTLGGWHVAVMEDDVVLAHAAVVPRILQVADEPFNAGYVEGVATAPDQQGNGFGSLAMTHISRILRTRFQMGGLSTGSHGFYERLGWERWRGPTFVREGRRLIRTPEDDDGVMVLRFGRSDNIDLAVSLSCESRRGDAW